MRRVFGVVALLATLFLIVAGVVPASAATPAPPPLSSLTVSVEGVNGSHVLSVTNPTDVAVGLTDVTVVTVPPEGQRPLQVMWASRLQGLAPGQTLMFDGGLAFTTPEGVKEVVVTAYDQAIGVQHPFAPITLPTPPASEPDPIDPDPTDPVDPPVDPTPIHVDPAKVEVEWAPAKPAFVDYNNNGRWDKGESAAGFLRFASSTSGEVTAQVTDPWADGQVELLPTQQLELAAGEPTATGTFEVPWREGGTRTIDVIVTAPNGAVDVKTVTVVFDTVTPVPGGELCPGKASPPAHAPAHGFWRNCQKPHRATVPKGKLPKRLIPGKVVRR